MPRIIFVAADGSQNEVVDANAENVMEVARHNGVDGIMGDCGGMLTCGTCHAYVDPEWIARTGEPSAEEGDLLQGVEGRRTTSRLLCQLRLAAELDGLILHLPSE